MSDGLRDVMYFFCRVLLTLLGGIAGYQFGENAMIRMGVSYVSGSASELLMMGSIVVLFSLTGFLAARPFVLLLGVIGSFFERQLRGTPWSDLSAAVIGLVCGMVLANLLAIPFLGIPAGPYIAVILNVLIGYVAALLFVKRQKEIRMALENLIAFHQDIRSSNIKKTFDEFPYKCMGKIMDTSVIIDGRILDIAKAGFLQGVLVLPRFVLVELQSIADSKELDKRNRGRQGLDVVRELQKLALLTVIINEENSSFSWRQYCRCGRCGTRSIAEMPNFDNGLQPQ